MSVMATCEDDQALKKHYEQIDLTLKQCQSFALDNSPAVIESLRNLYNLLIDIKPMAIQSAISHHKVGVRLKDIATDLIQMNRVIMSIDDEIDGVVRETLDDNFEWYYEALNQFSGFGGEQLSDYNATPRCDAERWLDKCLDLCGYGVSLEIALDCLRRAVHYSSSCCDSNNNDSSLKQNEKTLGISTIVTSLRTIRRYLLQVPSLYQKGHVDCCPISFQLQLLSNEDALCLSKTESLWNCCILPLEYHCKYLRGESHEIKSEPILGDSLTDFTSVLPTLVSSACRAMNLSLPWWAAPKTMNTLLIQAAWKMLLIGELVGNRGNDTSAFQQFTTKHFKLLARQMIMQNGQSTIVAKHFYHCWKHFGNDCDSTPRLSTPRSLLTAQCRAIIESTTSTKILATFYKEMLRCSAKNLVQKYKNDEELNMTCKQLVLPFLQDTIHLPLVGSEELRDVIVNAVILSPPSSFQHYTSPTGHSSLSFVDRAVPRCVSLLLHLASLGSHKIDDDSETDSNSESDDDNAPYIDSYLSQLGAVASVWSEDVFISRTDVLQQQFITEFLLYPLQQKIFSEKEFQRWLPGSDTSLATMLVQGITLRLDISLSRPIRMDGMRIAEAMASLLGQQLRFDELHAVEESHDVIEQGTKVDQKKKKAKSRKESNQKIATKKVLDPDAEYFSDDSDSSSSQSEVSSGRSMNASSEDEESLEAYSLDDDEEDLRSVPLPRKLQDCFAYLVTPDSDTLAFDKQQAVLTELAQLVESKPFDLIDMTPTLVRVLLHLEDKYGVNMFADKKWECLLAFGIHAPLDTCVQLVEEIRGGVSLGTRIEALSILAASAERLSVSPSLTQRPQTENITAASTGAKSTRLKIALGLREDTGGETDGDGVVSKTRRWRNPRVDPKTTTNNFGPIAAHIMYSLFAFMASTKEKSSIWGGATGERFLSEFIKTLSIMVECASTYPSHAVSALAADLFQLAWSFHDANSVEVRRSVLLAMATCMQVMPIDVVTSNSRRWMSFLKESSMRDSDEECRKLSTIMMGSFAEFSRHQYIE